MERTLSLLALCGLVLAAGCLGGGTNPSDTPSPTSTQTNQSLGERAISAEQTRIEGKATEYDNLSGLGFGILVPAESEVVQRNGTGAVVRVTVGYSYEVDCDGDGDPDSASDGATTETTYFVDETDERLLTVAQDFYPPDGHC